MNGTGTVPLTPRPSGDWAAIALRVLLMVIGYAGLSLLNWILLLRLALLRRRALDWVLFGLVGFVLPGVFLSLVSDAEEITGPADATGSFGVFALWFFTPLYFVAMDIQYRRRLREEALGRSYATPAAPPYPYDRPQPPVRPHPQPYDYNPYRSAPTQPPAPAPVPPPATPHPPRINQVRAELDELSDLLREQEGKH